MRNLGYVLEDLYDEEQDAGLGNSGLGRLAACFLDSLATNDYPAWGYGIRYKYGMFSQKIINHCQMEDVDNWLSHGNPWEVERLDIMYPVHFYGTCKPTSKDGSHVIWEPKEKILAVAYDTPIPGYSTYNTLNMRLWSAKSSKEFDLSQFNSGNFYKSIEDREYSEQITAVLYPSDDTPNGKELRLKQQYFMVSATIQDLLRRFRDTGRPLHQFPEHVAIQLNETHPVLAVIELLRILIDVEGISWNEAFDMTKRTFSFTCHSVSVRQLEKWSVELFEKMLPRHLMIIYQINHQFLLQVSKKWPEDVGKLSRMSIIEEGSVKMVRMAHLAIATCHTINGVAEVHSQILRVEVFPEFFKFWPERFYDVTNGVTPRRWIHQANPSLSLVISSWTRTRNWVNHLDLLSGLKAYIDSGSLQKQWANAKADNKARLAKFVEKTCGIRISTNALFDVHTTRIAESKRQLLNIIYVIYRYMRLKEMTLEEKSKMAPRVVFFAGKAVPGYDMAKLIIRLINSVADTVNSDKAVGDLLKVVFLPNFSVSMAEIIIPGADLSQHISTAGSEASGTSNMKFMMNGCLIVGTMDGANVEIHKELGEENMFIFGTRAYDVEGFRRALKSGEIKMDQRYVAVLDIIERGYFGKDIFNPILDSLRNGNDHWLLSVDFASYAKTQEEIDAVYKNHSLWIKKSILSTASSPRFSSDRSIKQYANHIWNIKPSRRTGPVSVSVERLQTLGIINDIQPSTSPSNEFVFEERMREHVQQSNSRGNNFVPSSSLKSSQPLR
eukprot:TRINITY_DN1342_c0_g1_i7.p1 TRINITY_DN1342_c0_g1~~TRINITY_DN1342_c0_g1_i7.p1  ORF type:complete len:780 (+),score=108.65 TRINITY_DN1342_c0_g1_i7:622-2961(+)